MATRPPTPTTQSTITPTSSHVMASPPGWHRGSGGRVSTHAAPGAPRRPVDGLPPDSHSVHGSPPSGAAPSCSRGRRASARPRARRAPCRSPRKCGAPARPRALLLARCRPQVAVARDVEHARAHHVRNRRCRLVARLVGARALDACRPRRVVALQRRVQHVLERLDQDALVAVALLEDLGDPSLVLLHHKLLVGDHGSVSLLDLDSERHRSPKASSSLEANGQRCQSSTACSRYSWSSASSLQYGCSPCVHRMSKTSESTGTNSPQPSYTLQPPPS